MWFTLCNSSTINDFHMKMFVPWESFLTISYLLSICYNTLAHDKIKKIGFGKSLTCWLAFAWADSQVKIQIEKLN